MTQEEKDLLFKDLCSRVPYGLICKSNSYKKILFNSSHISLIETEEIKPYLFPMSSVTEEQKSEFFDHFVKLELKYLNGEIKHSEIAQFEIDFYNKKHLDYRGLISKGLALDATNLNIY